MVWPPYMLEAAEAQIKDAETLLHDQYAHRKNTAMANISVRGLTCLDLLWAVVDGLSDQHRTLFHFPHIHRYLRIVYKLSRSSRKCLRDVKNLRVDLEQQIRALDHPAVPAQSEDNAEAATLPHTSLSTNSVDTMV